MSYPKSTTLRRSSDGLFVDDLNTGPRPLELSGYALVEEYRNSDATVIGPLNVYGITHRRNMYVISVGDNERQIQFSGGDYGMPVVITLTDITALSSVQWWIPGETINWGADEGPPELDQDTITMLAWRTNNTWNVRRIP